MGAIDLSRYDNSWYKPGRGFVTASLWFFAGLPIVRSKINPFSGLRCALLRAFGAKIGTNVEIKPGVQVKYPWHLQVGDNAWIGENAWIDNLTTVSIGSSACISQGAYLCTGNHDWSDPKFGLIVKPISIGDGAWVGAKSVLVPGIQIGECGIAAAGSVVMKNIPAYEIHAGNPAQFVRRRAITEKDPSKLEPLASGR